MKLKLIALILLLPITAMAGAPDVVLKDMNGKDRNVNEYIGKGKWTVVMFWAHDCHVCNQEVHQMTFFHDEHKNKDAVVLGISLDGSLNRKKAQDFVDRHNLNFPNLLAEFDPGILSRFGAGPFYGTPTFLVFDERGTLLAQSAGATSQEEIETYMKEVMAKRAGASEEKS